MISDDSCLLRAIYTLIFVATNLGFFSASAFGASSTTSFTTNVPFECLINNRNTSAVALETGESTLSRPDAVKLSATSEILEVSGNGFADIIFDYNQTKGEEAYYTFLHAISPILAPRLTGYMSYYLMQNSSLVSKAEGGFPRLTNDLQPIKIFFRADVNNRPGEQYEFEVTMSCLQKTQ